MKKKLLLLKHKQKTLICNNLALPFSPQAMGSTTPCGWVSLQTLNPLPSSHSQQKLFWTFTTLTEPHLSSACVWAKSLQSCLTLCDPMDRSLPGSSVHGDSPGRNTRAVCHSLLQGIFPTQGSNPGLPHCGQMLYHLSHQGYHHSNVSDLPLPVKPIQLYLKSLGLKKADAVLTSWLDLTNIHI